jgi:hypothetical protein
MTPSVLTGDAEFPPIGKVSLIYVAEEPIHSSCGGAACADFAGWQ